MIFSYEEFNEISTLISFPENQIWKDLLYKFSNTYKSLENNLIKNLSISPSSIDELENIFFYKLELLEKDNKNDDLFKIAGQVINFVVESEEFFDTDLEKSCPEVRIIYNMVNKLGKSSVKQKSFKKLVKKLQIQLDLEIKNTYNPSTITALNSIINATDENYKSAAFHSVKEALNTWIPYFVKEYSDFGKDDAELIIKAMKFTLLDNLSSIFK